MYQMQFITLLSPPVLLSLDLGIMFRPISVTGLTLCTKYRHGPTKSVDPNIANHAWQKNENLWKVEIFVIYGRSKWRKKKQGSAHLPRSWDEECVRLGCYRQGEIHPHFPTCWHWHGCRCHENLKKRFYFSLTVTSLSNKSFTPFCCTRSIIWSHKGDRSSATAYINMR